ncbi:hypothetical protein ACIA98_34505 [Streptomyces sp. NPDC051366]|uniref:hypothetical protein n=1 Tax=Streptomyces sp. NPDC051366 TaxID=3365652 RepID=UPI0037A450E6
MEHVRTRPPNGAQPRADLAQGAEQDLRRAQAAVEQWPDEPRDAVADRDELAETVRRAAWSEADAPG